VYLLDTVVRITPAGLWLTELKRSENQICLEGIADTNASISELLRNLKQQKHFENIKLSEVKNHKKKIGLFFRIELEHVVSTEENEGGRI
jgi:type IV pilus assembly protein PilN